MWDMVLDTPLGYLLEKVPDLECKLGILTKQLDQSNMGIKKKVDA